MRLSLKAKVLSLAVLPVLLFALVISLTTLFILQEQAHKEVEQTRERLLGDAVFANIIMLGFAWQHGLVPVSLAALLRAIDCGRVCTFKRGLLAGGELGEQGNGGGVLAVDEHALGGGQVRARVENRFWRHAQPLPVSDVDLAVPHVEVNALGDEISHFAHGLLLGAGADAAVGLGVHADNERIERGLVQDHGGQRADMDVRGALARQGRVRALPLEGIGVVDPAQGPVVHGAHADAVGLDVGLLYYAYPSNAAGFDAEYFEPYVTVTGTLGPVTAKVGANYAWDQDSLGGNDSLYLRTDLSTAIPQTPITLSAHLGYTDGVLAPPLLAGTADDTGLDWSLGASATVLGSLTLGVSYVGVEGPSIDGFTDDAVVFSLGASF